MSNHRYSLTVAALVAFSSLVGTVDAQTTVAPDNTKTNSNSVNSTNPTTTADGQKNNMSDLKLTQAIRKSVMADKQLSTYAHNVKIVAVNGAVSLNGVVRSDQEKTVVQAKAEAVAGRGNVTNDLKVAPPK